MATADGRRRLLVAGFGAALAMFVLDRRELARWAHARDLH